MHSYNYHHPIWVQKMRKNHWRLLLFELPLFFWYLHSNSQLLQVFTFCLTWQAHCLWLQQIQTKCLWSQSQLLSSFSCQLFARVHLLPQMEGAEDLWQTISMQDELVEVHSLYPSISDKIRCMHIQLDYVLIAKIHLLAAAMTGRRFLQIVSTRIPS